MNATTAYIATTTDTNLVATEAQITEAEDRNPYETAEAYETGTEEFADELKRLGIIYGAPVTTGEETDVSQTPDDIMDLATAAGVAAPADAEDEREFQRVLLYRNLLDEVVDQANAEVDRVLEERVVAIKLHGLTLNPVTGNARIHVVLSIEDDHSSTVIAAHTIDAQVLVLGGDVDDPQIHSHAVEGIVNGSLRRWLVDMRWSSLSAVEAHVEYEASRRTARGLQIPTTA